MSTSTNEIDAHEPTEEKDVERVAEEAVPLGAGDLQHQPTSDAEDEFSPFDEIGESCIFGPIRKIVDPEGIESNIVPPEQTRSDIPHLSPETLVCMGRFDKFVLRDDYGDVVVTFEPSQVCRTPSGEWLVAWEDLTPEQITELRSAPVADEAYIEVQPIRPPCRHYVRQMTQFEHNPENMVLSRLCAARRTTEGTFATVRDIAIWACDMREPRDLETEKRLDEFDETKVKQGREATMHSMFKK